MARDPSAGITTLRDGNLERWLRRGLGDSGLASAVEDATRLRATQEENNVDADATLLAKAIAILDPLAPLCWRGLTLWPDGIGPALADAQNDRATTDLIVSLIAAEAIGPWASARHGHGDEVYVRREARQLRGVLDAARGKSQRAASDDGPVRLRYQLNPLLPCASALLAGAWVADLGTLLPTLEAAAARVDPERQPPYDRDIAAFIAARSHRRDEREEATVWPHEQPAGLARAQLALYASLQDRLHPTQAMPGLARWLATQSAPLILLYHRRPQRQALQASLASLAEAGQLPPMLALLGDPVTRDTDRRGAVEALAQAARIDATLQAIAQGGAARDALARRMGQELATGAGLAGLAGVLTALVLG